MGIERIYYDGKEWKDAPSNWKELEENNQIVTIPLHSKLRKKCDNILKVIAKKWDAVICIDGPERSGKSTVGKIMGWYLSNGKLTVDNFAAGMQDAAKKIERLPDKSILIVDEGSLVFNAKDAMKREALHLQKILDVIGAKNMIFIIILPSFFDLNKNVAVRRSRFLLHVYTDKQLNRGKFLYFSTKKKRQLYELGKKSYGSYKKPRANWKGEFYDFLPPFEEEYLELKAKSRKEALAGEEQKVEKITMIDIRAHFVQMIHKNCPNLDLKMLARGLGVGKSSVYEDLDREIPDKLLNLRSSRSRIDIDFDIEENKPLLPSDSP